MKKNYVININPDLISSLVIEQYQEYNDKNWGIPILLVPKTEFKLESVKNTINPAYRIGGFILMNFNKLKKDKVCDELISIIRSDPYTDKQLKKSNSALVSEKLTYENIKGLEDIINGINNTEIFTTDNIKISEENIIDVWEIKEGRGDLILKIFNDGENNMENIQKPLYDTVNSYCEESDIEKLKNLLNDAMILEYPEKDANIFDYVNKNVKSNTFQKSLEQLSIIVSKLKAGHDFNKGKINEIILTESTNLSSLFVIKFSLPQIENKQFILILKSAISKDISIIERIFRKSKLYTEVFNTNKDIEEDVLKNNTNISTLNKYLKTMQDKINLINISKKENKRSIIRFDYSRLIMEPGIFDFILELFYIDNFKDVLIKSQDNYFYINHVIQKKEQELCVLNIKTIISEPVFQIILARFDK